MCRSSIAGLLFLALVAGPGGCNETSEPTAGATSGATNTSSQSAGESTGAAAVDTTGATAVDTTGADATQGGQDVCEGVTCSDQGTCVAVGRRPTASCECDAGYVAQDLECVAVDWQLDPGHYEPAQIPLEIIAPRPALTTASRYYKAYPGLQWRVPISVLGGAWPFRYEIMQAPEGMQLGETYGTADYGILSWDDPGQTGSPHPITVRVTDQEGSEQSIDWTLTVGSDGFLFVDAANGSDQTGDGSVDSPFQTMAGWLGNDRNDATYDDFQVYYFTGTYFTQWDYDPAWANSGSMPMRQKPVIHLAYPGEQPVFDLAGNGGTYPGGSFRFADAPKPGANDDIFFEGIEWRGVCASTTVTWQRGLALSNVSRLVVFENTFGNQAGPGIGGMNPAWFVFGRDAEVYAKKYLTFRGNTIRDLNDFMFIEAYDIEKIVVEDNTVESDAGGRNRLVYFKELSKNASVRANTAIVETDVWLVQVGSSAGEYDEIEACWNNWRVKQTDTPIVWFGIEDTVPLGEIYCYRNNLTNGTARFQGTAGGGEVWLQNNVRQYNSGTDGITLVNWIGTYSGTETDLVGTEGLVDETTNQLTGRYRTTHLGLKGSEVD